MSGAAGCVRDRTGTQKTEMSNLTVPQDLGEITPAWLTAALHGKAASSRAAVTGYSAEPIAEGKGFMNQVVRLRLHYDDDPLDLPRTIIAKLPSADPALRMFSNRLGQDRREVRFYQEVATDAHLQTPHSYHGGIDSATGNTILLLEDLNNARQGDSVAGCSLAEARRALAQLAEFQAAWWDSPRLDQLDWMPLKDAETGAYQELYAGAWMSFIKKAGDGMPPALRRLGDRLSLEVPRIKAKLTTPPRTIIHGDYRLDNCFFQTSAGAQSLLVFDWEFCARGRGTYDVATFVSEAFPPQQRRNEELSLLRTYHSILVSNGVKDYPFAECLADYRLAMLEIFVFWIVTGGYCDFDDERATVYLHNSLERFDAAISDLAATELLSN